MANNNYIKYLQSSILESKKNIKDIKFKIDILRESESDILLELFSVYTIKEVEYPDFCTGEKVSIKSEFDNRINSFCNSTNVDIIIFKEDFNKKLIIKRPMCYSIKIMDKDETNHLVYEHEYYKKIKKELDYRLEELKKAEKSLSELREELKEKIEYEKKNRSFFSKLFCR